MAPLDAKTVSNKAIDVVELQRYRLHHFLPLLRKCHFWRQLHPPILNTKRDHCIIALFNNALPFCNKHQNLVSAFQALLQFPFIVHFLDLVMEILASSVLQEEFEENHATCKLPILPDSLQQSIWIPVHPFLLNEWKQSKTKVLFWTYHTFLGMLLVKWFLLLGIRIEYELRAVIPCYYQWGQMEYHFLCFFNSLWQEPLSYEMHNPTTKMESNSYVITICTNSHIPYRLAFSAGDGSNLDRSKTVMLEEVFRDCIRQLATYSYRPHQTTLTKLLSTVLPKTVTVEELRELPSKYYSHICSLLREICFHPVRIPSAYMIVALVFLKDIPVFAVKILLFLLTSTSAPTTNAIIAEKGFTITLRKSRRQAQKKLEELSSFHRCLIFTFCTILSRYQEIQLIPLPMHMLQFQLKQMAAQQIPLRATSLIYCPNHKSILSYVTSEKSVMQDKRARGQEHVSYNFDLALRVPLEYACMCAEKNVIRHAKIPESHITNGVKKCRTLQYIEHQLCINVPALTFFTLGYMIVIQNNVYMLCPYCLKVAKYMKCVKQPPCWVKEEIDFNWCCHLCLQSKENTMIEKASFEKCDMCGERKEITQYLCLENEYVALCETCCKPWVVVKCKTMTKESLLLALQDKVIARFAPSGIVTMHSR